MLLALLKMRRERVLEFGARGTLLQFRKRLHDLVLGAVQVAQSFDVQCLQ